MNDIKVFVKADPSKELQDEIIEILEINQNCFKGTNEPNLHSAENIVDLFKPISLTELMVGFAEWCALNAKSINYKGNVSWSLNLMKSEYGIETEKLLEIYLTEKGVVV